MFAGFLFSRVALSISMFLLGVNAIRDINPRAWFKNKWWLLGVVWVIMYAVTYFWSTDKGAWDIRWQTKFPFLLLPLAFSFLPRFTPKQLQIITTGIAVLLLASVCYSMSFLITDPATNISKYRIGDVLPTLPKHDHIRASLGMALFVVWSVYVWPLLDGKKVRWLIGIVVGLVVIYIHVLADKSGLVSLYLFLFGWGIYLAFTKNKIIGVVVIVAIPLFVLFGLKYLPTFREKAQYVDFTWFMLTHGDKSGNYGDINRLMSYKVAAVLIEQHPLLGVGTGDMLPEMSVAFHRMYPEVREESIILPHNQFLIVGLGCGIPAMILFTVWIFMPLAKMRRNRQSFFFFIVWLILFLQLMIEPVLEVQYGVFVYLYFLLMQKHELAAEEERV
jgi:O-antigen ligase